MHVCVRACVHVLTLLDIMMVSRDLLWELKATLRVVAWTIMRRAWRTEERRPLRKTSTTTTTTEFIFLILLNRCHMPPRYHKRLPMLTHLNATKTSHPSPTAQHAHCTRSTLHSARIQT